MLIRPKSASRTRTRHVASETSSIVSESLLSNPNSDKNDAMESRLSEPSLLEDMIPSIQAKPCQAQMEINESTNKRFRKTRNETRKRSISSQDHITRKIIERIVAHSSFYIFVTKYYQQNLLRSI